MRNRISALSIYAFLDLIKKPSLVSSIFVWYWGFFIQKGPKHWVLIPCSIGIPICLTELFFGSRICFFFFKQFATLLNIFSCSFCFLFWWIIFCKFTLLNLPYIDHELCQERRPTSWCQMEYILKVDRNLLIFRWKYFYFQKWYYILRVRGC